MKHLDKKVLLLWNKLMNCFSTVKVYYESDLWESSYKWVILIDWGLSKHWLELRVLWENQHGVNHVKIYMKVIGNKKVKYNAPYCVILKMDIDHIIDDVNESTLCELISYKKED